MQVNRQSRAVFMSFMHIRNASAVTTNPNLAPVFVNRNPRNLERLRIAYKPDGYHVEKPGKTYWHKLNLTISSKYITATVNHFENGEVLRASTSEWCIKKYLYRAKDTAAFINLGRVSTNTCNSFSINIVYNQEGIYRPAGQILGLRCLQTGLTEICSYLTPAKQNGKVDLFLKALEESGIELKEPPQFKPAYPWDQHRPEKPWEVVE